MYTLCTWCVWFVLGKIVSVFGSADISYPCDACDCRCTVWRSVWSSNGFIINVSRLQLHVSVNTTVCVYTGRWALVREQSKDKKKKKKNYNNESIFKNVAKGDVVYLAFWSINFIRLYVHTMCNGTRRDLFVTI